MAITSALVVFAVIWFLVLFCVLPLRNQSQAEAGDVEPGTPASAPSNPEMRRKFILTTIIAAVLWLITLVCIVSGLISVDTFNLYDVLKPGG